MSAYPDGREGYGPVAAEGRVSAASGGSTGAYAHVTGGDRPRMLELCGCEGGATAGYRRAGWHVTSVDLDLTALRRGPADIRVQDDALRYLAEFGHTYDAIHASFPCQRWSANGANTAADKWPDLITPGRELLNATGRPWVMENVPKAPLRRDLVLCGSQFGLTAVDTDGTTLHLRRHRVFESNMPLAAPGPCSHPRGVQWAGVYGGARKDKVEARTVRKGGYVPPDAEVQSALLGGVPWMTGKGRRECIPPVYAEHIGRQLLSVIEARVAA
jgi:DNA (cytosine-5)-methyltransferase 1